MWQWKEEDRKEKKTFDRILKRIFSFLSSMLSRWLVYDKEIIQSFMFVSNYKHMNLCTGIMKAQVYQATIEISTYVQSATCI